MFIIHRARLLLLPVVLAASNCIVAAESDVGAGGGGAGGGESIGVAEQAVTGCCCEVPVGEGKAGQCRTVGDPSECKYEEYKDGVCNSLPPTEGRGFCSVSGAIGDGGHGALASVERFAILFALALSAVVRRHRRRVVFRARAGRAGLTASRLPR